MSATEKLDGVPVNRLAAVAVQQRRLIDAATFDCPSLIPIPFDVIRARTGTSQIDLTGVRAGHLTFVGLIEFRNGGNSKWAARCDCGRYELRIYRKFINRHVDRATWRWLDNVADLRCSVCHGGRKIVKRW